MPLDLPQLQALQADELADDVEIDLQKMTLWTVEQATAYFESGGQEVPPSRAPAMARGVSAESTAALNVFVDAANELLRMEATASAAATVLYNPPAGGVPSQLRNELAQLSGAANRLLENRVDATSTAHLGSGRGEAK